MKNKLKKHKVETNYTPPFWKVYLFHVLHCVAYKRYRARYLPCSIHIHRDADSCSAITVYIENRYHISQDIQAQCLTVQFETGFHQFETGFHQFETGFHQFERGFHQFETGFHARQGARNDTMDAEVRGKCLETCKQLTSWYGSTHMHAPVHVRISYNACTSCKL